MNFFRDGILQCINILPSNILPIGKCMQTRVHVCFKQILEEPMVESIEK